MSNVISPQGLIDALSWRYAVKLFDSSKKIDSKTWNTMMQSAILSASSFGLQPWKFIVVQNADVKKQLRAVSWNQSQIEDCSHLLVIAGMKTMSVEYIDSFISEIASQRGISAEYLKDYAGMMKSFLLADGQPNDVKVWAAKQCYIVLGQLLASAAVLGVDSCPMEGFDASAYDKILGLEGTNYGAAVIMPFGYRSQNDEYASYKKVRFSESALVVNV